MITKPAVLPPWADGGDKVQPTNDEIQTGWPSSPTPPSRQRFNWILNFLANAVRYFCQRGLPDWDAAETYSIGARCIGDDGSTWVSLQNANTNHPPSSSPVWWRRWGFTSADMASYGFTSPTAQEPPEADDSTKIPTTSWVRKVLPDLSAFTGGADFLLDTPGFVKLPSWLGGVIIQWGQVESFNGFAYGIYAIEYPTRVLMALANDLGVGAVNNACHAIGVTGLTDKTQVALKAVDATGTPARTTIGWIAIGY